MTTTLAAERPTDLAASLGQERIVEMDHAAGRAVIEYRASLAMCHSGGVVQGGFIAGWLDAAMAHAVIAVEHEAQPMSLELKVSYFETVGPGLVRAEGWIERRGRSTCFVEARLTDAAGKVLAKATSTVRLIPRAKVQARIAGQEG